MSAAILFCPYPARAGAEVGLNYAANLGLPEASGDIRDTIVNIIKFLLTFIGLVAVVVIIYAGYLWTTSGGSPDKIARAKKTLINALIGLVVAIAAFAIVTFVFRFVDDRLTGTGGGGGGAVRLARGIGAIGACAIESVYPEPFQANVPRNTPIIVTFKEEVDPSSVIGAAGRIIDDGRIKIHMANEEETNYLRDVAVTTTDNYTFIFQPLAALGSPSVDNIGYRVYLSNSITRRADGRGIFTGCSPEHADWEFSVGTSFDLTPPQVRPGGIFPLPDGLEDHKATTLAAAAQGTVIVSGSPLPRAAREAQIVPASVGGAPAARIDDYNRAHAETGELVLTIDTSGAVGLLRNDTTGRSLGSAVVSGQTISFPSFFTLSLSDPAAVFEAGQEWEITASAAVAGDTLTVGGNTYTFVITAAAPDEIEVGATAALTAARIAAAVAARPEVGADAVDDTVTVTAATAGAAGNRIALSTSNPAALTLSGATLAGGADAGTILTPRPPERRDQPRNAVIRIDFNEAMSPVTLAGPAADIRGYVRVKCLSGPDCSLSNPGFFDCGGDACLDGRFVMSNQYRTVEFFPSVRCGVNSCGEDVYCLPADSEIEVFLRAAPLEACATDADCAGRSPFNECDGANCHIPATGEKYPLAAVPPDGIVDLAFNSLDGDRSGSAEGPGGTYDENAGGGAGDNYRWSFWISDEIETSAPVITALAPGQGTSGRLPAEPVTITFNKLMLSSSLRTGETAFYNGRDTTAHKNLNLWSAAPGATGYWIAKTDRDTSTPPDDAPDITIAEIRHSPLAGNMSYRAQVGSGVKDIYQNCFQPASYDPSAGGDCAGNPSCCPVGGALTPVDATGLDAAGNCR